MRTDRDPQHLSWELPDALWQRMEPLIPAKTGKTGHPRTGDLKRITAGIFYVLRTGMPWQACPRARFGPPSTVYDYFAQWVKAGVLARLWVEARAIYDDLQGLEWTWQSIEGAMTKAPLGGEATGANPTDRGKQGTTRSVLTDGQGIPLAVVVAGANRHAMKLLAAPLDAVVRERPEPTAEAPQHLCADKGYDDTECREEAARLDYIAPSRTRGEERQAKQTIPGYQARRWVVEVCHSWLNRFRKILVRFEKKLGTQLALLQLACAYIVLKRAEVFR
jgi:putative transposase